MSKEGFVQRLIVDLSRARDQDAMRSLALSIGLRMFVSDVKNGTTRTCLRVDHELGELCLTKVVISTSDDVSRVISMIRSGVGGLLVEAPGWKIIPIENLLAEAQKTSTRIFAEASSPDDAGNLMGILERGVDGAVISPQTSEDLMAFMDGLSFQGDVKLQYAVVQSVAKVGMGDRACVDTASLLAPEEGLLVGVSSSFLFFVNSETQENPFVPVRPFRVNAGAVSNYVLLPDGRTKYLSEIGCGDRVLVVNKGQKTRVCVVGRTKIESRPLIAVKASAGDMNGSILLQDAETIRLPGRSGNLVSVRELRPGDEILVSLGYEGARHLGVPVKEFVLEK